MVTEVIEMAVAEWQMVVVVVVVAATMEVTVMMGTFRVTAVRMAASSPGPSVSQTSDIFAGPPCWWVPLGEEKRDSLHRA